VVTRLCDPAPTSPYQLRGRTQSASIEVERITSVEVGLQRGEPSSGTGLRIKPGVGRLNLAGLWVGEAGLPTPRRELANRAEPRRCAIYETLLARCYWHAALRPARERPRQLATRGIVGGDDGNRTHDPLLAKQTTAIRQCLVNGYLPGMMRASLLPVLPLLDPCSPPLLARQWHGL